MNCYYNKTPTIHVIWSRSSAYKRNECVKCDKFYKVLLVITVTANSNKWQQALGFVSCARVSKRLATQEGLEEKASADQPGEEYEHVVYTYCMYNTSP